MKFVFGYLRRGYYHLLRNAGVKAYIKLGAQEFSAENALVITGSPRSGTTWLSNIFSAPPGFTSILEPLHPEIKEPKQFGFSWRTFIPPDEKRPDVREYLNAVFSGKTANGENTRDTPFPKILKTKMWVIKFVRANRLLPWLVENFSFKYKPVLVIRHPCEVVYSQMKHPSFRPIERMPYYDVELVEKYFPKFHSLLKNVHTEEEIRALSWGLDNFIPFYYWQPEKWIVLSYEELVLDSHTVLNKVYSEWGLEPLLESLLQVKKRSREAREWSQFDSKGKKELGAYKKFFTREQICSILDIAREIGFVGFSENIEPDYDRLYQR